MAKNSFFIRAIQNLGSSNTFAQTSIDLGSFVDALGKTILKVHNVAVKYADSSGTTATITGAAGGNSAAAQFQITTQSQTAMVNLDDKSVVASGHLVASTRATAGTPIPDQTDDNLDMSPQAWTNGYLVGVEQIYIGGQASTGFAEDVYCSIVLECTVESLSQSAAMALALSQQ